MKLIRETVEDLKVVIEEGEKSPKRLYLEGIFLQGGIKNKNGRLYPPAVLESSVAKYQGRKIDRGTAYGEFGHPNNPIINPERISHRIVSLNREGDNWKGKALVLDEGYGKIVKNIIETGGSLGMSSRSLGSLQKKGDVNVVQEDLDLCTAGDIVIEPSAPDAWVQGIMEGEDWVFDAVKGWHVQEFVEDTRKKMKGMLSREIQEQKVRLFENYLKTL